MLQARLGIDRKAAVERTQLDAGSWIDVIRGFVREPEVLFEAAEATADWRITRALRDGRWIDNPRLFGSFPRPDVPAALMLRHAGLVIEARYRARFRGFGLLLYRDGTDSIGPHRDRELRFLEDTIAAGVSLGGTRPFCLRSRFGGETRSFMIETGDAYIMGGRCQADWLHSVPKVEQAEPKISAIWRWTSKRGKPESRHEWAPQEF